MNKLIAYTRQLPVTAILLTLTTLLLGSCNTRRADGSLTIVGVAYVLLAVLAFLSLIKQDWSIGKKIIWGLIIWFFPFGGSVIYFLFSGRKG